MSMDLFLFLCFILFHFLLCLFCFIVCFSYALFDFILYLLNFVLMGNILCFLCFILLRLFYFKILYHFLLYLIWFDILFLGGTNQYPPPELTEECGGSNRGDTLLRPLTLTKR